MRGDSKRIVVLLNMDTRFIIGLYSWVKDVSRRETILGRGFNILYQVYVLYWRVDPAFCYRLMWKVRDGSHTLSLFHLPFNINLPGKEIYILDEIPSLSNGKVAIGCNFWEKWLLPLLLSSSPLRAVPHPASFVGVACVSLLPLSVCLQACTARHPSVQPVCQNQFTRTSLSEPVYKNQFIWINLSESIQVVFGLI